MRNLIIHYSPFNDSYTEKIAVRLKELFEGKNESVVTRDLRKINFNPVITEQEIKGSAEGIYSEDVRVEQSMIADADNICMVFPVYQLAMPAVMKGYVDRVLVQGFSYIFGKDGEVIPLMKGKKISIFSPMGATLEYMTEKGHVKAMNHIIRNTFEFRGFEIGIISYFDYQDRDGYLEELLI